MPLRQREHSHVVRFVGLGNGISDVEVDEQLVAARGGGTPDRHPGSREVNTGADGGYVEVTDGALNVVGYLPAPAWSPSRSNWTTSFDASLSSGEYFVRVACDSIAYVIGSRLTVR